AFAKPTHDHNLNGAQSPGGEGPISKPLSAFQDQLTFKKALAGGHNVSLGLYFANYSQTNQWYFTDVLMDVQDNPHFVDLTVNNATVVFRDTTAAGVKDSTTFTLPANLAATKNGFRKFRANYVHRETQ